MRAQSVLLFVGLLVTIPMALDSFAQERAPAKPLMHIGFLSCNVASGWGFVFGSSRKLQCTYTSESKNSKAEYYTGNINRVGTDIGYSKSGVMLWSVYAPGMDVTSTQGFLAGSYQGQTASAAFGSSVGGQNSMRGGEDKSIELRPINVEGNTGLNLAAGVSTIVLKFSPSSPIQ
jgi:Protein of unknown function (DUF992)